MNIVERINAMKKAKNALLLAHFYVDGAIQDAADFVGDSFELARIASEAKSPNIIMAGVTFMVESVKILNPDKHVFGVNTDAGCPMATMVGEKEILDMRRRYENLAVVCYVNSMAAVKALSDVCVTSANALKIVKSLPQHDIFFIPDKNLAQYIKSQVPEKNIMYSEGFCPVHNYIDLAALKNLKAQNPGAKVLMHPEAYPEALLEADFIGSTRAILNYARQSEGQKFIIATEEGIGHKLREMNPQKEFIFPPHMICEDMKKFTAADVLQAMDDPKNEMFVDAEIAKKALIPLRRMLEMSK